MRFCLTVPLCVALATSVAEAQRLPGFDFASRQFRLEQLSENHVRLIDEVEIDGGTYQFYADQVDIFTNESRLVATGNVVYTTGGAGSPPIARNSTTSTLQVPSTTPPGQ